MKGYYLFAPAELGSEGPESGVAKKVRSQSVALNKYISCELIELPMVEYDGSLSEKIIRRLPFTAAWRKWEYKGEFDDVDFLYMRSVYHDDALVRYFRDIKKENPKIKIIYEIPTYPYGMNDRINLRNASFYLKERICREKAAKYMDRIVTFYGQKEIWGVPCIDLINGFDFSKVEIPKRCIDGTVHIMSVSVTAYWHGYDRIIEGIREYYENGGTENIVYHLVGDILPEHKKAVEDFALDEHVKLHGRMYGEQLKNIYKISLLGVDVLGGHRHDYPISSSLKSREYAAYGLPIITSSPVDYLPENYPYQFIASYDDSPLDIQAVLKFYHRIYDNEDCDTVAKNIREYAVSHCDMDITMKPVADFLKEKNEEICT